MYRGVFPILPTTFTDDGALDLESQKRAVEFLIDAGVSGICILANYSEQFALTDDEREQLTVLIIDQVAGRVPVIVTTSHFSTQVAAARSRHAQDLGAKMVMLMPPYHGTALRADDTGNFEFFRAVADAITIPIMIQDAPLSGVTLSAAFLARLAREIEQVKYLKIEVPRAADKLREVIRLAGSAIDGPFDGEESVTLIPDLDAGATGTMPSSMVPDILGQVVSLYQGGQRSAAIDLYNRYFPLIHFENRQCGLLATKVLMREGGIITSDAVRHPLPGMHPATRAGLVELATQLQSLIVRWGR